jgi:hypothetical protein
MKRIFLILLCTQLGVNILQSQELPDFVRNKLDSVKKMTEKSLKDYRIRSIETKTETTLPHDLRAFFYKETELIDSLELNLSIGMIYDDVMRNRIVQLMRNEYEKEELDTLVNIYTEWSVKSNKYTVAFDICKFDTLTCFKAALDSFYTEIKNKNPNDSSLIKYEYVEKLQYKYDIFMYLQLDTTAIFKHSYDCVIQEERKRHKEECLTNTSYDHTSLAELCGYIVDKRFIQPLEEALYKPDNFQRKKVMEALARMRVEPYYSDYVKERTLTPEQIQNNERIRFSLNDFVYVLGTQEAFLELSKYLLSDKPYQITIIDYEDHSDSHTSPISDDAFDMIQDNIKNQDLQKIIGAGYIEDYKPLLRPVYDWMQKNYGKYKIKRIW